MENEDEKVVSTIPPASATKQSQTTAANLIAVAVQNNMPAEQLGKLMDLQERWEQTEARKKYLEAFALFQKTCPVLTKNKIVAGYKKRGSTDPVPEEQYRYAPLSDIAAQIGPALQAAKLSYRFDIQDSGEAISVSCIISHRAGHQEKTTMSGGPETSGSKNTIQARGSTVTYLQRYTLIGALGLTTADADMDGRLDSEHITDDQAENIKSRLQATGGDVKRFCAALSIPDVDAMPASKYAQADNMLAQKEAAINNPAPGNPEK